MPCDRKSDQSGRSRSIHYIPGYVVILWVLLSGKVLLSEGMRYGQLSVLYLFLLPLTASLKLTLFILTISKDPVEYIRLSESLTSHGIS